MKKCLMIFAFLFVAVNLYAANAYDINCSKCGYKTTLYYGRGEMFEIIANGYCLNCDEYVRIRNKDFDMPVEKRKELATPVGYIYSPYFGNSKKRGLFPCPNCKKPFLEIRYEDIKINMDNRFCPKCNTNNADITLKTWE